jgi:hypothetical protein
MIRRRTDRFVVPERFPIQTLLEDAFNARIAHGLIMKSPGTSRLQPFGAVGEI